MRRQSLSTLLFVAVFPMSSLLADGPVGPLYTPSAYPCIETWAPRLWEHKSHHMPRTVSVCPCDRYPSVSPTYRMAPPPLPLAPFACKTPPCTGPGVPAPEQPLQNFAVATYPMKPATQKPQTEAPASGDKK